MSDSYSRRGVSAAKEDVHFAIKNLDKGLYPNAFCKVLPDLLVGESEHCIIMHADGAGTKSSLAYLYWKETGDLSVWRGIAQDGIVMNTDDMLCAGSIGPFMFSNTIGRNAFKISREVLAELLQGMEDVFEMLGEFGIKAVNTGGETADVGDLVRTLVYDVTAVARMRRDAIVTNENIQPGSVIVGLASSGQATYEKEYNSGIASNGLTNARHDSLEKSYAAKYPEAFDPQLPAELVFSGKHKLTEIESETGLAIGKLLLSPTRTYLPVMQQVFAKHSDRIHGLIHCTGGGQTKVMKFVNNLHVIKDNLFEVPPVFRLIQESSQAEWREMYTVFNMGHRLEIYTDEETAPAIIEIAKSFNIDAQIVGRCEQSTENKLSLKGHFGEMQW